MIVVVTGLLTRESGVYQVAERSQNGIGRISLRLSRENTGDLQLGCL